MATVRGFSFPVDPADTPGLIVNGVYPASPQLANGQLVPSADTAFAYLFFPDFTATCVAVGVRVNTAGGAGALMKAAVFPHDPVTLRPGPTALGANNAGANVAGAGQVLATLAAPTPLLAGRPYWLVTVFSTATPLPSTLMVPTGLVLLNQQLGLGLPAASIGGMFVGYSAPLPFANNISAANALLGATWSGVGGGSLPSMMWQAT